MPLDDLYKLPPEMARPVARGLLPLAQAQASLRASVHRRARLGDLEGRDPEVIYSGLRHLLALHLRTEQTRRALAGAAITRTVAGLTELRKPSNVLYAEAHNANAAQAFALAEQEVTDLVRTAMLWAIRKAKPRAGRRHG